MAEDAAHERVAPRFAARGLDWIEPRWDAAPRVRAFVTTRNRRGPSGETVPADFGGAWHMQRDGAPEATHDDIAATRRDATRFLPADPVYVAQVHGTAVSVVHAQDAQASREAPRTADALVTRALDLPLAIRVADCMPVLLAARHVAVVGIAHAGWRGLAAGVLEATLAAMDTDPAQVDAWLGPSIGAESFEVGPDVLEAFCRRDAAARAHFRDARPGKWLADLGGLARARLAAAGVRHVTADGGCTYRDATRFHSWRRDGTPSRMAAFIWQGAEGRDAPEPSGPREARRREAP